MMTEKLQENKFFLALLFLALLLIFFLPPIDPDLGWQLRCGQQIWQKQKLCLENEFSVLMPGYRWPHSNSLYQFLLFPFHRWFGLFGLSLANALLMTASFVLFFALEGKKELKILSLPLIFFFSWSNFSFGIRGQLMSFFYFLLILKLVEKASSSPIRWLILSPVVLGFWANSHGGFVLGLVLLFGFLLEKTIRLLLRQEDFRNCFLHLTTFVLSGGATLLNPSGFKIYIEAWRHFAIVPLNTLIAEWVPPIFWLQILIIFFSLLGVWLTFKPKPQKLPIFKLIILLSLALLAFKARRNLPFFFTFWAYLATGKNWLGKFPQSALAGWSCLVVLFLFCWGFLLQLPKTILANSSWPRFCLNGLVQYPCSTVEFLKKQPEKGNLFNRYEWGGFLIWQLPEYKIFVDGRMPAWPTPSGKSPYTIYLETLQAQPGWQETLTHYNINWILISPGTFMDLKLKPNPKSFGWQEVFRDEISVVYKKI